MPTAIPNRTYSSFEAADAVGVPHRTLMKYVAEGLLTPEVSGTGHGARARWSEEDLRQARVLLHLLSLPARARLPMEQVKLLMEQVREGGDPAIHLREDDGAVQFEVQVRVTLPEELHRVESNPRT